MVTYIPEFLEKIKNASGYYVYAWVNADWGNVYFYIGKGKSNRGYSCSGRSKWFKSITDKWNCYPTLIKDGLSEEDAYKLEFELKTYYLLEKGHPIMDGEGESGLKKATRKKIVRAANKKREITLKEFSKKYRKLDGDSKKIMAALNITRGVYWKWYRIMNNCQISL